MLNICERASTCNASLSFGTKTTPTELRDVVVCITSLFAVIGPITVGPDKLKHSAGCGARGYKRAGNRPKELTFVRGARNREVTND